MTRLLILSLLFAFPVQAQDAGSRLQEALRLERSIGDYEGAIAVYRDIAGDASADRRVVAQALIQLGKAYESLGRTEAFDAYQRVARDFSDQKDLVAEARERMAGLAEEAAPEGPAPMGPLGIAEPLVKQPFFLVYSTLSGDGRYFQAPEKTENGFRAAIQNLDTGEIDYLVVDGDTLGRNIPGLFSPDSRHFIFTHWNPVEGSFMTMEAYDRETGASRTLLDHAAMADYNWAEPYDWTTDGSGLLVALGPTKDAFHLDFAVVDFHSGSVQKLARLEDELSWNSGKPCLMDDRFVLYNSEFMDRKEVRRLDLNSGDDERLFETEAQTRLLACSDAKRAALILNDEYGDFQARVYPMEQGLTPAGPGIPVAGVRSDAVAIGSTESGLVMYRQPMSVQNKAVVVPYDPNTGRVAGEALKKPTSDWARPAWSGDGSRFAVSASRRRMYVEESDGSTQVTRIASGDPVVGYSWSPDGSQYIVAPLQSLDADRVTHRMNVESMKIFDTLENVVGTPGRAGAAIIDARMTNEGQLCIDEYEAGIDSRERIGCYDYPSEEDVYKVWISPNGEYAAVEGRSEAYRFELGLIDLSNGTVLFINGDQMAHYLSPSIHWLPDSSGLIIWSLAGYLTHFDLEGTASPWLDDFTETRFVQYFDIHPVENLVYLASHPRESDDNDELPPYWVANNVWEVLDR